VNELPQLPTLKKQVTIKGTEINIHAGGDKLLSNNLTLTSVQTQGKRRKVEYRRERGGGHPLINKKTGRSLFLA